MVSEYLVKLCAMDGTPYRLYSTHTASDTEIIPTFAIISICADFDNGTISLRYNKPNVENKPTELVLTFDKSVSEPVQRFVSEVQSDIVRRETLFETNRLKAEAEVGDIPAYDRTEPKRRKYNYASGRIEGDELSDCYGEYKGDGTYYLGDYVGGKMHGNGYLRLTVEDDPILAAPDETEIYEGIFVGNSFRFGEAFRDGGGVTVTYGEFSGRNASGYGTRRTCSYGYSSVYEGSFEADSFSGFGRYADLGEKYIYIGEFSHGLPNGVGDMILENGVTVHCDTVSRGSVVGEATITVPGQEPYRVVVGPRMLERTVSFSNGDEFLGKVSPRGVPVAGTLTKADGTVYGCSYKCGILTEKEIIKK